MDAVSNTDGVVERPAGPADIPALSHVLGRAFFDDPVTAWLLPDAQARRRKLHRLFAALTRYHHLARGGVEVATVDERIGAAALWDPPGAWRHGTVEQLRAAPGMLVTFGTAVLRGLRATELMKGVHPEEPHWYLAVIGSDPQVRGAGLGRALLRSRLDRCDAECAPAYLESSNPDNIGYYQRFGFEVTGEIVLPDGGPVVYPMWRSAR